VWKVGPGDIVALDRYEGVTDGRYQRRILTVTPEGHDPEPVIAYVDHRITVGQPREGYMEKVVAGAAEFGLPGDYQRFLADWLTL
jgi:hypothetical protein